MAEEADVVIAWAHGGIPNSVHSAFKRPTRFINLPNEKFTVSQYGPSPIRGILAKYAPGVTPLRIGLLGFSASCAGVAAILATPDGEYVDATYACDGIHTGYTDPSKPGGVIKTEGLAPWLKLGSSAIHNDRLFLISHSSVVPSITDEKGTRFYASTTETANWLWKTLTSSDDPYAAQPPMPDLKVSQTSITSSVNGPQRTVEYPAPVYKRKNRDGGLIIWGLSNVDKYAGTTDHVYQAKMMMPAILAQVFAARWNAIDPKVLGQACFIGDPPRHPSDLFILGGALGQSSECAKSVVLPANYMSTALPGARMQSVKSKGSIAPWVVGGLVVAGVAALAMTGGVLEENPGGGPYRQTPLERENELRRCMIELDREIQNTKNKLFDVEQKRYSFFSLFRSDDSVLALIRRRADLLDRLRQQLSERKELAERAHQMYVDSSFGRRDRY